VLPTLELGHLQIGAAREQIDWTGTGRNGLRNGIGSRG
jgi:hypothetical protein